MWNIFAPASKRLRIAFITFKPALMTVRSFFNKAIILCFMGLVGFSLAKGIYTESFLGIVLALVALGAGIYFLYVLAKVKTEYEAEETAQ
jgi:hypothetical protein